MYARARDVDLAGHLRRTADTDHTNGNRQAERFPACPAFV